MFRKSLKDLQAFLYNSFQDYQMSAKRKGSNTERELIRLFQEAGWGAIRVAGSGSNRNPSADILAGSKGRMLVIECKSSSKEKIYISDEQIEDFKVFGTRFGAELWVGLRFNRTPWCFLELNQLTNSGKSWSVAKEFAQKQGISFEKLIKETFI
jgi:holliday junction resolvase Hjr